MSKTSQVHLPVIFSPSRRLLSLTLTLAVTATIPRYAPAVDALAYSFENDLQGFGANGVVTVTQDTIGATEGTHSMKVTFDDPNQTFVGALTDTLDPNIFGDPPGLDHVHFDLTITQRYDHPAENPPGFADIGVTIFGNTQPDFPGGEHDGLAVQIGKLKEDQFPTGSLAPGTYRDVRIDLDKLSSPFDGQPHTFNQIFGTLGSGQDQLIPVGFEFYFNKNPGATFPWTVYIDNVRFGTSVPGDYNGNDVVDAADYVLWRKMPGPIPVDVNFRNEVSTIGTVDASDYTAWRARFSNTSASGSGLINGRVPEPASIALLLTVGAANVFGLRKRNLMRS